MSEHSACVDEGDLPQDYSDKLPRGVPAAERPATSMFPFQTPGPADVTWYFPLPLDATNPTGVFFPQGFSYGREVDVILYFHGNKDGAFSTINQYWHGDYNKITLREDLNASQKNAVLIAPTMGYYPGRGLKGNSDLGIFREAGGATCFLDHVMKWIGKYEPRYADNGIVPHVGQIVLAGHSGGGSPMHLQMESLKSKLCEIWCFDVVYWGVEDWVKFAKQNPTKKITFYYAVQSLDSLQELQKQAKGIGNIEIKAAGSHHFPALTDNFRIQLKKTTCLSTR